MKNNFQRQNVVDILGDTIFYLDLTFSRLNGKEDRDLRVELALMMEALKERKLEIQEMIRKIETATNK